MGNNYSNVLKRLAAYRKKIGLNQTDITQIIGITQGEYSYIETGRTKLSGEVLKKLYEKGWDIDYIISGKTIECGECEFKDKLIKSSQAGRITAPRFAWAVFSGLVDENKLKINKSELRLLQMLLDRKKEQTVLFCARRMLDKSQAEIAYMFGISIKLYRELEKGKRLLDAESLEIISRISACLPTLFLNLGDEEWRIAGHIWGGLNSELKTLSIKMINQNLYLLNSECSVRCHTALNER